MGNAGVQLNFHHRSAKIDLDKQEHETPELDHGISLSKLHLYFNANIRSSYSFHYYSLQ